LEPVFFTQSPSFLAFQKYMQKNKGVNNAQSLFGIQKIPSDNHIRDALLAFMLRGLELEVPDTS
jgi:hypothetical protein